jgi:hypothetical protein
VVERAGDIEALGRVAANAGILAVLAAGAQPSTGGPGPWSPDGHVMRTHPDLTEVLAGFGEYLPDGEPTYVYGMATLVHPSGVLYAVASSMSHVYLRLGPGPIRAEVAAAGGEPLDAAGEDWLVVRIWDAEQPTSTWWANRWRWVEAAFARAVELADRPDA